MQTIPKAPESQKPARHLIRDTFRFIQIVVGVAFLLATLFTVWTDPGLLSINFGEKFSLGLPPQATGLPAEAGTATPRPRPLVGIVVGHWDDTTKDPGAICPDSSLTEFEVNQNVATRVQADLVARGIDVDLLKEFDPRLEGYQALALVSIHTDSCEYINAEATGFKVAAALSNPHPERAARLTACLRSRYGQDTGLKLHNSITADMSSYHAFGEINPDTTAAIIEVGFLNLDRKILTEQPDLIAKGITDGIVCFINNENIPASITPTPTP